MWRMPFNAAFRIPNLLQNLFGEGVLSASFIPIYSGLLARGQQAESRRLAAAAATLLLLTTVVTVSHRNLCCAPVDRDHRTRLHRT